MEVDVVGSVAAEITIESASPSSPSFLKNTEWARKFFYLISSYDIFAVVSSQDSTKSRRSHRRLPLNNNINILNTTTVQQLQLPSQPTRTILTIPGTTTTSTTSTTASLQLNNRTSVQQFQIMDKAPNIISYPTLQFRNIGLTTNSLQRQPALPQFPQKN